MRNQYWLAAAVLLLGGCGGGSEDKAVSACSFELETKLAGKTFKLDAKDMRAQAKVQGENEVHITSTITFDPGLQGEYKQSFDCKARVDGATVSVISLTFNW